jgi:hypothetical protein
MMSNVCYYRFLAACFATLVLASMSTGEESARHAEPISLQMWIVSVRAAEKDTGSDPVKRLSNLHATLGHSEDVASLIAELENEKAVVKLDTFRIATIADRGAGITLGWRKPRITSTAITQLGTTNGIAIEPLGTTVNLIPHVESDGSLRTEIKLDTNMQLQSNDVPISVPSNGDRIFAATISKFQIDTEVRLMSGEAKLVAATPGNDASETALQLVILSASLDRPAVAGQSK